MYREELRVVRYTVIKKAEKKKSKKKETKKVKKVGLFHLWGREEDKKGKEVFFALVEDLETGDVVEVSSKNIRFLSDDEIDALTNESGMTEEIEIEEADEDFENELDEEIEDEDEEKGELEENKED